MKIDFRKTIVLTVLALLIAHVGYSQKMIIKFADKAFHDYDWLEAINLYTTVYEGDNENVYVMRKLAACYDEIENYDQMADWLSKIIDMSEDQPEDWYNYYFALKSLGRYDEAQTALEVFAELMPRDERVNLQQSILDYINFLVKDSSRFTVELAPFNSRGADWGPMVHEDKVVFVSTGNPEDSRDLKYNWDQLPYLDIYAVDVDEFGKYSKPKLYAEQINTAFHDGPVAFDYISERMYFNSNRSSKNSSRKEEANNLQIFYAEKENGDWVYKGEFEYNNPSENYQHPSISADGQTFYFSSDRPGGKGGSDLWYCNKEGDNWGEPINMTYLNTKGHEVFPFIGEDGVLYFSSDGLAGMGGLDIYMAFPFYGEFSNYENMGYPVNSPGADFGLVLDKLGMHGYFASNRGGGMGHDDIYEVSIDFIPVQISGRIRDRINTFEIEGATVALVNESNDTVATVVTKENGAFNFIGNKQQNYTLAVAAPDYEVERKDISTFWKLPNEVIDVDIFIEMNFDVMGEPDQLEPLTVDLVGGDELQIIQIDYINYAFDSDVILESAKGVLDKVTELVLQYPDLEVKIESHTDAKGSDSYNLRLSEKRAASAYKYIISKGIDPKMIEYDGYGETQLLNHCEDDVECNEEEHALNRRSIIKIIRKGRYTPKKNSRNLFYF